MTRAPEYAITHSHMGWIDRSMNGVFAGLVRESGAIHESSESSVRQGRFEVGPLL